MLVALDAFRRPERVAQLAMLCEADKRGRLGMSDSPYPNAALLARYHSAAAAVKGVDIDPALRGPAVGEALRRKRIAAIAAAKAEI